MKDIKNLFAGASAVGAFNVILIEHAEAMIAAAEQTELPIILQISENTITYHGALKPIAVATRALIQASSTKAFLHLDHAENQDLVRKALDLGFDSIMYDGSRLEYAANVETSRKMAELAHSYDAVIEVELGEVGGKDGVHAPGVRTNPEEAATFVEETGVDLLAVAVGSSHAMMTRNATLDFDLIRAIASKVSVPLVLHGSSGVSDLDIQEAVRSGMRKINIATHLNNVFTQSIREVLAEDEKLVDPRMYLKPARLALTNEVARLLNILALR